MKTCTKCNKEQVKDNFYKHKHTKDNLASVCKSCFKENEVNWRKNNPETYKTSCRKRNLKKKFGITLEKYEELYIKQQGKCACCQEEKPNNSIEGLVVDHNHTTGVVRELLCSQCNTALGLLKEDKEVIKSLLEYIRKHNGC